MVKIKLSVVIPVYNEKNTILKIIEKVQKVTLPAGCSKEIIVVDDFSYDGTRDILKSVLISNKKLKVFFHDKNQGKGGALRTGFSKTTGDYVVVQDADLEYDPEEYNLLLKPVIEKGADVVFGSRFYGHKSRRVLYYWHAVGNKFLTLLSNMLSDLNLTDMETCFKLIKGNVARNLDIKESRFGIEPEITAKLATLARSSKITLYEVGISYFGRTYEEGKKIGWKDGFSALRCILIYNSTKLSLLLRYGISGTIILIFQLLFLLFMVEVLNQKDLIQMNIAHAISMETGLLFSFLLHSKFTWSFRNSRSNKLLFLNFQLIFLIPLLIRAGIFFALTSFEIDYFASTMFAIGATIILNYFSFEKLIYNRNFGTSIQIEGS